MFLHFLGEALHPLSIDPNERVTPNHVGSSFTSSAGDPTSIDQSNGASSNGDGVSGLLTVDEEEDCCDIGVIPPPPMFSSSPPEEEQQQQLPPPGMLNYLYDKRMGGPRVDHNGDLQNHHLQDEDDADENLAQIELELSSGEP